jgi:hypothetical protein
MDILTLGCQATQEVLLTSRKSIKGPFMLVFLVGGAILGTRNGLWKLGSRNLRKIVGISFKRALEIRWVDVRLFLQLLRNVCK